ncbi:MAG: inositol monophosphatase family protein [Nitrososphaerota archaeon]
MVDFVKLIEEALRYARDAVAESFKSGWVLKTRGIGAYGDRSYGFDLAAEKVIIDTITDRLKNVTIISEELGMFGSKNPDYYVIIDPVDGSKNASRGIPFYSSVIIISKTLSSEDIVAAGVINHSTGEIFVGGRDGYISLAGGELKLNKTNSLKDACILLNHSSFKSGKYHEWARRIVQESGTSLFLSSTALEICYILMGKVDGYVCLDSALRPFDFMASIFLLRNYGGAYTILFEDNLVKEIDLSEGKRFGVIATCSKDLLQEIINLRLPD